MLYQATDSRAILEAFASDQVRGFCFRNFSYSGEDGLKPILLVDSLTDPEVAMVHAGANFMVIGQLHRFVAAFTDLLHGCVEQELGWSDPGLDDDWKKWGKGKRFLFINSSPLAAWRAAQHAGFDPHPDDLNKHVAYLWHWQGEPRFKHRVEHNCRAVERGMELYELMLKAVEYDPEGHYIKQCLANGPSFVCEEDGEPKCWSCTHTNGTMGMIYTPDELRRQGYAKSLAAFQIDYMLARDSMACCHVIDDNIASMNLVADMGAQRCSEPMIWRSVYWPGEAPLPGEDRDG